MASNVENTVKNLLQLFMKDSVPEYLKEMAQDVLHENSMSKFVVRKDEESWDIEATIQGEDFQIYSPRVTVHLADMMTSHMCNCPEAFSGVCRHVAAILVNYFKSLEEPRNGVEDQNRPRVDWKQSFRNFFSTSIEPESGHHYLVFRLYPEPGRLLVAFYRARQNKTGLSTVHNEVTLEQIVNNPEWCELSPALPQVAHQIGQYLDYWGHKVELPDGLISWFFWVTRKEHYLFWKDTETPCRFERNMFVLKTQPLLDDTGLRFELLLHREGKAPIAIIQENDTDDDATENDENGANTENAASNENSISSENSASGAISAKESTEELTFHGQFPLWVSLNRAFYPVQTSMSLALVHELVFARPHVPHEDISEFLDRVWTRLPASELYGQEDFLAAMEPVFQPARYRPKLFLDEEGSLLTLEIQNCYETVHGEFVLNGPNPDFQTGSYTFEGATFLIRRSQEEEASLLALLAEMHFQPRNSRLWFLEPEEAVAFLLDVYPKLVEIYRVYGEKALSRYKVRTSQPVITATVESNEKEKWFNLDISIEYEGQSVALEKIWKAWTKGKRYVQLKDGSYTSLPESWLNHLAHKLQVLGFDPTKPPQKQFQQYEVPVLDTLLDDFPNTRTDSFWDLLREKLRTFSEVQPIEKPKGLDADLRSYQLQGVSYLNFLSEYGFGGILADEMGLGKTIQTLAFIQHMVEHGLDGPNLIVVPTSVLPNWDREAQKFVPSLKRLIIYGAKRENMFGQITDSNLVITTYALLRRDMEELEKYEFNSIILDEAQNIKNPGTITAHAVRNIQARMRLCLSGTPIENNLFELWSLFEFLMPGFLGSQHAFQRGIVKPIKDGDPETLEYLRNRVKPFILRRTKSEVAKDLPPKIENVTYCALVDEQAELYAVLAKKLRDQVFADVDEKGMAKSQMSILDALLKLRQICCHPRLLKMDMPGFNASSLPSGKFDTFKDMIVDIVAEKHKVLVFSQFVQMLHLIRSWLQMNDLPFCYLDGASKDRFDQVDKFNDTPEIPIFLISLKAGGTGLNLTSADYVIHYDPWWNPAVESQATDRTHRIGQTRQVFAYKLICQNTVEEKILKLQEAKKGVAEAIIPGQDAWKSLTREDLEMLFEV